MLNFDAQFWCLTLISKCSLNKIGPASSTSTNWPASSQIATYFHCYWPSIANRRWVITNSCWSINWRTISESPFLWWQKHLFCEKFSFSQKRATSKKLLLATWLTITVNTLVNTVQRKRADIVSRPKHLDNCSLIAFLSLRFRVLSANGSRLKWRRKHLTKQLPVGKCSHQNCDSRFEILKWSISLSSMNRFTKLSLASFYPPSAVFCRT